VFRNCFTPEKTVTVSEVFPWRLGKGATEDRPIAMSDPSCADRVGRRGTTILGLYLVALGIFFIYLTAIVWPPDYKVAVQKAGTTEDQKDVESPIILFPKILGGSEAGPKPSPTGSAHPDEKTQPDSSNGTRNDSGNPTAMVSVSVSYDHRLLLLVMIVGALGSYIHVASSFGDFVGNRTFTRSWIWWYLLRPYVGVPLAILFYFVVRAGFLTAGASAGDVNRFGIAAVAGLVGMFSVTAADKLKELFDTLFKTDVQRKDALTNSVESRTGGDDASSGLKNPIPIVNKIESGSGVIRILGSGFRRESTVIANGKERPTSDVALVSDSELTLALGTDDKGQLEIEVSTPPPGGGTSGKTTVDVPT
jgi:hypothetical protein